LYRSHDECIHNAFVDSALFFDSVNLFSKFNFNSIRIGQALIGPRMDPAAAGRIAGQFVCPVARWSILVTVLRFASICIPMVRSSRKRGLAYAKRVFVLAKHGLA
jgi:hypothetical protein